MPSGFCIFSDLLYEFRRVGIVTPKIMVERCFGVWWENGNRDAEIVTNSL